MARNLEPNEGLETAGILCVFQGFQTAQLGQKNRHAPQAICLEFPKTKVGLGFCPIFYCVQRLAGRDASPRRKSGFSFFVPRISRTLRTFWGSSFLRYLRVLRSGFVGYRYHSATGGFVATELDALIF